METQAMMPVDVRAQRINALWLNFVGLGEVLGAASRVLGDANETLSTIIFRTTPYNAWGWCQGDPRKSRTSFPLHT
jgi:hypothetical protein